MVGICQSLAGSSLVSLGTEAWPGRWIELAAGPQRPGSERLVIRQQVFVGYQLLVREGTLIARLDGLQPSTSRYLAPQAHRAGLTGRLQEVSTRVEYVAGPGEALEHFR